MSLLTLVQQASDAIGIQRPATVIGSSDLQVRQLLALAQDEGRELARRHDWVELVREQTFTTTAAAVQSAAIPSDFDRFVNGSMWNRTAMREVRGPLTSQQWQNLQANPATTSLFDSFRVRGTDLLIYPTPPAGETIAYEYVTRNWCASSGGTGQEAWGADTDTGLIPERLMGLGLVWRWKQAKGLGYAEDFATYEREVEKAMGRSGGAPVLSLSTRPNALTRLGNVPEGSWNA